MRSIRRFCLATVVGLGAVSAACGGGTTAADGGHADAAGDVADDVADDRPVDAGTDVGPATDAAGNSDGGVQDADAVDASTRPDSLGFDGSIVGTDDTTCNSLPNTAPYIAPNVLANAAQPPTLAGGTITDGRYELASVDYYPGTVAPSPHTLYRRTTELQQGGTVWQWVDLFPARPNAPPDGSWMIVRRTMALAWTPDGALTATRACGNSIASEWRFEVGTGTLAVWEPSDGLLERYVAVP